MGKLNKGKALVKKLSEQEKTSTKVNITFRMPGPLIEGFKKTCKSQGLSANAVAEELFKQFIEDVKP
jgi:predicted DNA binding CopG/RHH family protein